VHQEPATIVREARHRAGLSQRALAQRAGTTQSVVARIELGQTRPTWETVVRLVEAAGLALDTRLLPRAVSGSHMLQDVARIRALSPEARLAEVVNLSRFVAAARRA
jgi:transcriptional regulator with XRE-family HTH domain